MSDLLLETTTNTLNHLIPATKSADSGSGLGDSAITLVAIPEVAVIVYNRESVRQTTVERLTDHFTSFGHWYLLLGRRLLSAAILIGSVLIAVGMDAWQPLLQSPGLWLVPVMAFFVGGTALEFGQLASRQVAIRPIVPMFLSLILIAIVSIPIFYRAVYGRAYPVDCPIGILGWIGVGMAVVCGLSGLAMLRSFALDGSKAIERWALLTLIPVYAGGLGAFWIAIRLSGAPLISLVILVGIIAVTKITDASAYFGGKSMGPTKLCPSISPGKTVEGAVAGLLAGMLAAWLYFGCIVPWMEHSPMPKSPWWGPVVVGLLLGVVGLIGDLIESVVKRSVGAKDSGNLLPGLGGIWDVTDSLLPTTVVGYFGIVAHWI